MAKFTASRKAINFVSVIILFLQMLNYMYCLFLKIIPNLPKHPQKQLKYLDLGYFVQIHKRHQFL